MALTALTEERKERRKALRAMTPQQEREAYIQLLIANGYRRRDVLMPSGSTIICMVDRHYLTDFDSGLYNKLTHQWHPDVRNTSGVVICISA